MGVELEMRVGSKVSVGLRMGVRRRRLVGRKEERKGYYREVLDKVCFQVNCLLFF